jgi:GNAT superfamily N-acetyltransferase
MGNWVVEALAKEHERDHFSCGQASLDDFLKKFAKQYAKRKLGTTYVAMPRGTKHVVGYFTLAPSHFEFAHAPAALLKGLPKHPVPTLLLARLAVDLTEQGQGLGKFLLLSAFEDCLHVAQEVAFRAIEVEALDESAAAFYRKFGFLPFPTNPHHLAIPLETVEALLGT